ncbi:MAG: lipopolysaccharide kinase InaA family protein [Gemmataceae bacterium]
MTASHPAVTWHLPPALHAQLVGPNGLRLSEWLESGRATVVKEAPHRSIYHVNLGELDFYLKEYRTVGLQGFLRELARPVKAHTEFRRGAPAELGVPAPRPMGWGVLGNALAPRASFLLTETVVGAEPLLRWLSPAMPPRSRQNLAKTLGEFLARLHAAGVVHRDLHPGNVLARMRADDSFELFLVDLHEVRVGTPSPWHVRRANLAVFNRYFVLRATRSDRLRFWHSYYEYAASAIPDHPSATPGALEEATWRSNALLWATRDRRCQDSNRYFRRISLAGAKGHAVAELDRGDLEQLLANPEAPFFAPGAKLLKFGGASAVVEISARVDGQTVPVVWKRFGKSKLADALKNVVRPSGAVRSWVLGHGLIDAGLPTARPLAMAHRTQYGLPGGGYLLTAKIEYAVDLRAFVDKLDALPKTQRDAVLRQRIAAVGRVLRAFHRRFFVHRDLKAANLLTAIDPHDNRVWFIDLVGVRRRQRISRATRIRDLARLSASFHSHPSITLTDKLRFLRWYMDWASRGNWGWKRWWRELAAATEAKIARNARSGRPLG